MSLRVKEGYAAMNNIVSISKENIDGKELVYFVLGLTKTEVHSEVKNKFEELSTNIKQLISKNVLSDGDLIYSSIYFYSNLIDLESSLLNYISIEILNDISSVLDAIFNSNRNEEKYMNRYKEIIDVGKEVFTLI